MSRTRAALAALLLATAGLAGCSEDDPEPAPPTTPSEPPAASSATRAPRGPVETVRAWVDARNQALRTGDLDAVRELTAPACDSCDGILDPVEEVYRAGGHFETDGWKIRGMHLKSRSQMGAAVSVGLEFAKGRTVPESGARPVPYGAEKHLVLVRLAPHEDGWQVKFFGFLS